MTRRLALGLRMLVSFVLIVAAMPLRANAASCATPVKPVRVASAAVEPKCGMPCCVGGREAMACGTSSTALKTGSDPYRHTLAVAADPCGCELKSAPVSPPLPPKATSPGFDSSFSVAILPEPQLGSLPTFDLVEPGIFGVDSGPPKRIERPRDSGRAPPVARA